MNEEEEKFVNDLLKNQDQLQGTNIQLNSALQGLNYPQRDINLIQIQLENDSLLERLEHFYRGDYLGIDQKGNQIWKTPENKDLITFNDFGVSSLMEIVTKYIDKNTSLSNYSEERIYEILGDLGDEMILFMLCNYEKMGMNTYFKKTKFRLIIVTTLHIIESSYRRAIQGKTTEELNQSRIVTQNEGMGNRLQLGSYKKVGGIQKLLNPSSWGK